MKVVAILGGLGSQMIKYAFYLSIKEYTNDNSCFIDTLTYEKYLGWNGYELGKVFNLAAPDIKVLFSPSEINEIKISKHSSRTFTLNKMYLSNKQKTYLFDRGIMAEWKYKKIFKNSIVLKIKSIYGALFRIIYKLGIKNTPKNTITNFSNEDEYPDDYLNIEGNVYYDEFNHTSDKYIKNVRDKLFSVFKFPDFINDKNIDTARIISETNSIAMHIRRSDHMYDNSSLFENYYYVKCVQFMKSRIDNPRFFIFSDEPDWCKKNIGILGLNFEEDVIYFIDWNKSCESFRDMQLMSICRHNILAISSFSWWGYYLSEKKDKIVCAPNGYWLEVQYHF